MVFVFIIFLGIYCHPKHSKFCGVVMLHSKFIQNCLDITLYVVERVQTIVVQASIIK